MRKNHGTYIKSNISRFVAGSMAGVMMFTVVPYLASEVKAEENIHFYVSPEGSDSNPGTESQPFQTIEKAKDAVDKVNDNMISDITVYIMDGKYYLDETLTFTEADSGTNGYKVRYQAYEGATPEISGGMELDGTWQLHDAENNIYKIDVPDGIEFRQLYIDDERGIRARTGEEGVYDSTSRILGADRLDENGNVIPEWWNVWTEESKVQAADGRVFVPDDGRISDDMENLQDVELHILTAWSGNVLRVESLEKLASYDCQTEAAHTGKEFSWSGAAWQVNIQNPEAERIFNRPHPGLDNYTGGPHYVFYYENAYEYIDVDTEWYLDETENILYYKAPADKDMSSTSAVIPVLEEVLAVEGTLDNKVTNLEFNGLTIEHSTWLTPNEEGIVGGQAGQDVTYSVFATNNVGVKREGAGVRIKNAVDVRFDSNHIRFMGATGILLASGTEGVTLINNVVEETAGNGVEIGKFTIDENTDYHTPYNPSDDREVCKNDKILNNVVRTIGTQYEGSVGIGAGYVQGILIANNTVSDCPYTGISVGYGWTLEATPMRNNRILRNEIFHVNQIVCDGGGIYTLSNQAPDSYIKENYLHDNWLPADADYGASGLYLDEATSGYIVEDNVLVASYGVGLHITGPNDIKQNYIFDNVASGSGYENFLTNKIQSIMENAGVQDGFDENDLIVPEVNSMSYDPYYERMTISGISFGQEKGSILFKTRTGEEIVSNDNDIQTWSDTKVVLAIPETIKEDDSLILVTKDEKVSEEMHIESIAKMKELLVEEDFEEKQENDTLSSEWDISVAEKAGYTSDENGTYLHLIGNNPNLEVTRKDTDGSVLKFGENVTQYDFMFEENMSDYTGLYNQLCADANSGQTYHTNIRPAYFEPLSLEKKGVDEIKLNNKEFKTGVWYTCRTMVYDGMLYLAIFEKGTEEPENWELTRSLDEGITTESMLNFSYYDPGARGVRIDNITVTSLETEPKVPITEIVDLVASYDMSAKDGKLIDGSGNENHASYVGFSDADFAAEGEDIVLNFDGTNKYAELPAGLISTEAFIIEAAFKTGVSANSWLWCLGTKENVWPNVTNYVFVSPKFGDDTIRAGIKDASTEYLFANTGSIPSDTYITLRVEFDHGDMTLFADGIEISSMETGCSVLELLENGTVGDICGYIGKSLYTADAPFTGTLTQFDVYGVATEKNEISILPYEDVAENDWFYDAVAYTYYEELMTGMDPTHFGPYGQLSRAQFALILYRIEKEPEVKTNKTFADITGDEWYGKAVLWAAEAGIVTGYQNGNFGPADNITREQMAVMMYRYANYLKEDTSAKADYSSFSDAEKVSSFAADAMGWVVENGIITGKENGTVLDPQGNTARCEAAAIIPRFINN